MNLLIMIVLIVGAIIGFVQGAFKQIAHSLGVILGLILATVLYQQFGEYLSDKMGASGGFANTIAFLLIVVIVPVALGILASFLTKLFSTLKIGFLNRLAGAAIGVICYALLMSFAFNLMDFFHSSAGFAPENLTARTPLYYKVKHVAQTFVPDAIIVTDSVEVTQGEVPHYGLRSEVLGDD